jgi:hypothetical protein
MQRHIDARETLDYMDLDYMDLSYLFRVRAVHLPLITFLSLSLSLSLPPSLFSPN